MADISNPPVTDITKLKAGVEYEGRPGTANLPLIRGTFKKVITDHGDKLAVFDPMFMGRDEYHLVKTENSEDWARLDGIYNYFPLRIEATKKFAEALTGPILRVDRERAEEQRKKAMEDRKIMLEELKAIPGGEDYKKAEAQWKGGRRFTRKQCKKFKCSKMGFTQKASCRPYKNCYRSTAGVHKKGRTHKQKRHYKGPYINPTYNTLPFKW